MAEPTVTEPWAPDGPPDQIAAVFEAVGAASMCWDNIGGAGTFDARQATAVADDLIAYLRAHPFPVPSA